MAAKLFRVHDLPAEIRQACWQRGLTDHDEITARCAMEEWAGWWLGDSRWGHTAFDLIAEMAEAEDAGG